MKIQISGHHVDITDSIKTAVESKFEKIGNHYPDVADLAVILKVEKHQQSVEASTQYQGVSISASAMDKDMYCAIQSTVKKLEAALSKRKGSLLADRNEHLKKETAESTEEIESEFVDE